MIERTRFGAESEQARSRGPEELGDELITRLANAPHKDREFSNRHHGDPPV